MDVRVISERHILTSALAATLSGIADVRLLEDAAQPDGDILVLELRQWNAEKVQNAIRVSGRPVIAWLPVMAADMARCAVENGIRGVLSDLSTARDIENCVDVVARGEMWLPSDIAAQVFTERCAAFRRGKANSSVWWRRVFGTKRSASG
jgi:hypothetical protein